jgi:hypothetical protein
VYLREAPVASPLSARGRAGLRPARLRAFTPGHFARVRIVEAEGHELVGERA